MDEWKPPPLAIRVPWDAEQQHRLAGKLFGRQEAGGDVRLEDSRRDDAAPPRGRRAPWLWSPRWSRLGIAALVVVTVVLVWARFGAGPPIAVSPAPAPRGSSASESGREIWFRDGSLAFLERSDSDLRVDVADAHSISATLMSGRARFDVVPRRERLFRIRAGVVVIEVLGTAFSVERRGDSSTVAVTRGRVRISWPGGTRELQAGGEGLFPPLPPSAVVDLDNRPRVTLPRSGEISETFPPPPATRQRPTLALASPASPGARSAAATPSGTPAVSPLVRVTPPPGVVPPSAGTIPPRFQPAVPPPASASREELQVDSVDLLLAEADGARIAGRSGDAVEILRAVLRRPAIDGRAPLAAFTLGRLLLDELHLPQQAAETFARARALAPGGPLVEDTYLREVESWSVAGQPARAIERAREYLVRFAASPRAPLMQRLLAPR